MAWRSLSHQSKMKSLLPQKHSLASQSSFARRNDVPLGRFHNKSGCVLVGWEARLRQRGSHPQRVPGRSPSCSRLCCRIPLLCSLSVLFSALQYFGSDVSRISMLFCWEFSLKNGTAYQFLLFECVLKSCFYFCAEKGTKKVDKIQCLSREKSDVERLDGSRVSTKLKDYPTVRCIR